MHLSIVEWCTSVLQCLEPKCKMPPEGYSTKAITYTVFLIIPHVDWTSTTPEQNSFEIRLVYHSIWQSALME